MPSIFIYISKMVWNGNFRLLRPPELWSWGSQRHGEVDDMAMTGMI